MAIHGSGIFRFKVASSIPQKASEIQGDDRYTRPFIKNEGIVVRAPLGSGLFPKRNGIYIGFSVPYHEAYEHQQEYSDLFDAARNTRINAQIPYVLYASIALRQKVPHESYTPHNPKLPLYFNSVGVLTQHADHAFDSENLSESTVVISSFPSSLVPTQTTSTPWSDEGPVKKIVETQSGVRQVSIQQNPLYTPVPYLWGSVIEGCESGARRFIVGPLFDHVSNPEVGNFGNDPYSPLGSYGATASAGTGVYESNQLKFIMPDFGIRAGEFDHKRYNLFNYVADSQINIGKPLNGSFFENTPFSHSNIDYTGIRIRSRKNLPPPYNVADEQTMRAVYVDGTTGVDYENQYFGSRGTQPTDGRLGGKFSSIVPDWTEPSTRHAFAITKRHVLAMNAPWHISGWQRDADMNEGGYHYPDWYGFDRGLGPTAGKQYLSDTPYQKGDKIQFWDKENRKVIERTIVDSISMDAHTIHNAISRMFGNPFGRFDNEYDVGWSPLTIKTLGWSVLGQDYPSFAAAAEISTPIDGTSCNSSPTRILPTVSNLIPSRDMRLFYSASLGASGPTWRDASTRHLTDRYLQQAYAAIPDSTQGILYDYSSFYGAFGNFPQTSDALYELQNAYTLVTGATSTEKPRYLVPSQFYDPTLFADARNRNLILESPSSTVFGYQRLASDIGRSAFATNSMRSMQSTSNTTTTAGVGGYEGDSNQVEIAPLPPKDNDQTIFDTTVEEQFSPLPTAALNAIKEYFPHGLNNVFYGTINPNDTFKLALTWQYIISHFKGLLGSKSSIYLLDSDLPSGVKPISFIDYRRSHQHKHELFFDAAMRGFTVNSCAKQSYLAPFAYVGNPMYGNGTYAIVSQAAGYSNPYGTSLLNLYLVKNGKCGEDFGDYLNPCNEKRGSTSGSECGWFVWGLGVGEDQSIYTNKSGGTISPPDTSTHSACYRCWHEDTQDILSRRLPPNTTSDDRLNSLTKTYQQYLNGGDQPGPLFTYHDGNLILSNVVVGSNYRGNLSRYGRFFEYSVTGHHGKDLLSMDFVCQNYDGSTGSNASAGGMAGAGRACARVIRYSKDEGRLTLDLPTTFWDAIMSNDHLNLARCEERTSPEVDNLIINGLTCGGLPGVRTGGGSWYINQVMGVTAYAYSVDENQWMELASGGPAAIGTYEKCFPDPDTGQLYCSYWPYAAMFGYQYLGYGVQDVIKSGQETYEDCEIAGNDSTRQQYDLLGMAENKRNYKETLGMHNQLLLQHHPIGMMLSDQKVYSRPTNPNSTEPFYVCKISDVFYSLMNELNSRNGITDTYLCNKIALKYDPELNEYEQPFAMIEPKPITEKHRRDILGVHYDEKEFLK